MYNKRTWLNNENSPSTGNVVCFDREVKYKDEKIRTTFISISDCYNTAKLHVAEYDTIDDFILKLEKLNSEIADFIDHLKSTRSSRIDKEIINKILESPKSCGNIIDIICTEEELKEFLKINKISYDWDGSGIAWMNNIIIFKLASKD